MVKIVAATLLRAGFLVCTFNFRGAAGSAGRTSWTARPERADYTSVVGFLVYYAHFLDRSPRQVQSEWSHSRPTEQQQPILLMAGYSYGAMVTTKLAPLETLLVPLASPTYGSPASKMRLRAQDLAETQNQILAKQRAEIRSPTTSPRPPGGVLRVGGNDYNKHKRRRSHDDAVVRNRGSQSFSVETKKREESLRRGLAELAGKVRRGRRRAKVADEKMEKQNARTPHEDHGQEHHLLPVPGRTIFRPAYLLVSPIQGPIAHLAAMSFSLPLAKLPHSFSLPRPMEKLGYGCRSQKDGEKDATEDRLDETAAANQKLVHNDTLAVYGDRDVFVAARKLRAWAGRLQDVPGSRFRAHEVSGAGHFWLEERLACTVRDTVAHFVDGLSSTRADRR